MPDARPTADHPRRADARFSAPRRRRGALVVAAASLFFFAVAVPAGATDSTSTLQQRAAKISAQIAQDDVTLNALGEAYLQFRGEQARANAAAAIAAVAVHRLSGLVVTDRRSASLAADVAYVEAGASTDLGVYLAQKPDELVTSAAYLNSAISILNTAANRYVHAESNWKQALLRQRQEAAAATAALVSANTERGAVVATLVKEQRLEASIKGEIAQLVAQALAKKLAAERAAAVEAAAASAAAASAAAAAGPPDPATLSVAPAPPGSLLSKFAALRNCESSGNYQDNTGNGYYGAYQFSLSTWEGLGERGLPSQAAPRVQDAAAFTLYSRDGWTPWPACSAILGL